MDIRELQHFMEVVNQKSFTKAAAAIHLSQPALSKIVKKLEEELGVDLFDRSTRKLTLTDAGQIVYGQSQKLVSTLHELHALLDDLRNLPTGDIKVGIPPLVGTVVFPMIAKNFTSKHPQVKLELVELGAKRIVELVENEQVDLGIIVLPIQNPLFHVYPFIEEEFNLYIHHEHPLAAKSIVALSELREEPFVLFSKDFSLHDRIIHECIQAGFYPKIAYESSQWDLIIELVASELGIAILPKSVFPKINNPFIKSIPIAAPTPMWELGIILKKDRYMSYATRELLSFLVDQDIILPSHTMSANS
ncbi:LysR family transcriptional regulator [Priestia megaterium]|uniref:LysR family transcriptional regulator n=1 Tax=Priestia megaterium TaxID=1404 RepID=UPI0013E2FF2B|nr:LysR family transcriptional regulator [Priestia megaterium]MED3863620.1 LysR family transcriptional regulator [Priestia megaterium]MED4101324.1 LysR family transcriptional regulator [Priestia megaterium]MED4145123.1 LysR family transcriptional regulator [Priestia megaterium]MED4168092.1 LysR family transcriptional regulator [Priestia megaterium]MED4199257.1 LysR family transcriptional regulator [Priestia megaterium]